MTEDESGCLHGHITFPHIPLPAVSITGTHGQRDRLIMAESADPRRNRL